MNKEIKEKIELLKKKGLTIQEIKGILNLSNHDLYDKGDEPEQADPKTEVGPEAREKAKSNSSKGFETITISSNKAVNEFARQQERCLIKLINTIENPKGTGKSRVRVQGTETNRIREPIQDNP